MKTHTKNVLVGLSGGVDSSVAAMMLTEAGNAVTGVMMTIYKGGQGALGNACYSPGEEEDIEKAEAVAALLGIPFRVIDCVDEYADKVLAYFRHGYLAGETPNPCVRCNHVMKFGVLPARAREMGLQGDFFATGHYVRAAFSEKYGRHVLLRGTDKRRDQSYFLYRLTEEQIATALFPLGGMCKEDVRAAAKKAGLAVHDSPDSQNFYSGEYRDLLGVPPLTGPVVDASGKEVGRHEGYWNFTPGQRRGLGVSLGKPAYVLRVEPLRNRVVVGSREESLKTSCLLRDTHFHISPKRLNSPLAVRLRSSQEPVPARVEHRGDAVEIFFTQTRETTAPGQSAVLYDGDIVVGGGIIRP